MHALFMKPGDSEAVNRPDGTGWPFVVLRHSGRSRPT